MNLVTPACVSWHNCTFEVGLRRMNLVRVVPVLLALVASALFSGCGSTSASSMSAEERGRQSVALYKQGVQEFNDNKIDAGIATLKRAYEMQPDYTLLRYDLARLLIVRAERADLTGMQLLDQAATLRKDGKPDEARPKQDEAYRLKREAVNDLKDARDHLLWVRTAWPQEANVPYFLSIVSTGLSDYKMARKHLKDAIEIGNPTGAQREELMRALKLIDDAELQDERLSERGKP